MKHFATWGLCALLACGSAFTGHAQITKPQAPATTPPPAAAVRPGSEPFSTDPEKFIGEIVAVMATTKNAPAIALTEQFRQLWASNKLTTTQQAKVIELTRQMQARKLKPKPHLESFFGLLVASKQGQLALNDAQTDQMLEVTGKTLVPQDLQDLQKFLSTTTQFLKSRALYSSRYNRLRLGASGTISFAYNDTDYPMPAPAKVPEPEPIIAPEQTKAAPTKMPAKTVSKPAPKPAAKKKSSGWDDWDSGDWGGSSGWGSGSDDGWGTPVKKKAAPAKKALATIPAKTGTQPVETKKQVEQTPESEPTAPAYYSSYAPPSTKGPVVVLRDADLVIATAYDSVLIQKTTGSLVTSTGKYVGQGGTFGWQINGNPLTAELGTFDIDVTRPEFKAEPVTLTYPAVLEAPIKGALAYKSVQKKKEGADTGFPRFVSLTNDARIKNIGENIKYVGGFSLNGRQMYSATLDGSLSRITVEQNGKPRFRAASRSYQLGDTLIVSNRAAVTIFQDKSDSLTHPGVKLKYSKPRQLLTMGREEGLYKGTSYYDSYHQMELTAEQVTWNLKTPQINFQTLTAKNQVTADFESKEFYTNTRYQQIKSINKMHPLQMVVGYSQTHNNARRFTVEDMAEGLKLKEPNVRSAVSGLARDGYVSISPITGEVTLLPKAMHYVNSSRGKKDYDHIAIKSLSKNGQNATLDLNSNVLLVRGVDRFNFSDDSITVFVKPDSSIVRIQKNRNIDFNGTVVASAFIFKGKEFKFDYDGFFIDMFKIDSIIVKGKNSKGSALRARKDADFRLTNKDKHSAGRLYINAPNNKSGRKKLGAYPTFDATTGAYVFFNKPEVLGGAYDTTIYFDIPPFKLDSLNNGNRAGVGFKGTFVSGDIMPSFKTKLAMQEDGSLGFTYAVPKEGFPVYGGKARLFNQVKMSNRGIQGDGELRYLSGSLQSDQFIFYKDSVVTVGKGAQIKEGPLNGAEYPKVALLPGYQMKWVVKADSMYLSTARDGEAMRFYDGNYKYKGTATLTPKGLYGIGRMEDAQSIIRSPLFTFLPTQYKGNNSIVSVKSADPKKPALTAPDVAFVYDIKRNYAEFTREPNAKTSIDLPYSQYRTTLSGGRWDFKKKSVQLRVAPGQDSTSAYFFSVKPEQKGLRFRAATGSYDLNKYRLIAGGVPRIASADAWIAPDSNKVYILGNAEMRAFKNAGIVMDTLGKFHELYKGEIQVLSRLQFTGNALHKYKTPTDSFAIKFSNFTVDSTGIAGYQGEGKKRPSGLLKRNKNDDVLSPATVAQADIKATDKFRLAPRIQYRGAMTMNSQRKGFMFDGQARLEFSKVPTSADWFPVQDSIDPQFVRIKLKETKTEDGTPLVSGLYLSEGTGKPYPLFVAVKPNVTDGNFFEVDGDLTYDPKKRLYAISRHDYRNSEIFEGSVLTLNDTTGVLNFRGKLSLINSNKDYSLAMSGLGRANPDSGRYQLDAMMAFDLNFPDKALEAMAADMAKYAKGLPEALTNSQNEFYKLAEFAGNKTISEYANRKGGGYVPLQKVSSKFLHDIVLSQVNMRWSPKLNAWYSVGKIGLVSIGKKDINAMIDGYIEIKKESTGDNVELYLEADPETWYYFKYAENKLLAKAQHGTFDEILGRAAKGDYNTATNFGFFLGDEQEKVLFVNQFRKAYLGETKPQKQVSRPQSSGNFDFMDEKGKKKAGDEPAADGETTEDTGKKKKKKKKDEEATNDPFAADGNNAVPAEEPSKKNKKKREEVTDASAEPTAEPSKKDKKKKEEAAPTDAPTEPAIEPSKKDKKKNEEAAPAEEQPTKEPKKEKKSKKKNEDDPFGDE